MKDKITLTVDKVVKKDFSRLYKGSISGFLEEKMAEHIEKRRLQYNVFCHKCGKKTHLNVLITNGGRCPHTDCGAVVIEHIDGVE